MVTGQEGRLVAIALECLYLSKTGWWRVAYSRTCCHDGYLMLLLFLWSFTSSGLSQVLQDLFVKCWEKKSEQRVLMSKNAVNMRTVFFVAASFPWSVLSISCVPAAVLQV
jgi:hypothetical protein